MQAQRILVLLLFPFALGALDLAQSGDWHSVRDLPAGTRISVRYDGRFIRGTCFFQSATDDQLVCARVLHGRPRVGIVLRVPNEAVYERERIREVRLEHDPVLNGIVGAGIGAGVGATLGAAANNGTVTRGGGALLLGGIGALMGAGFGSQLNIIHGKTIYRR